MTKERYIFDCGCSFEIIGAPQHKDAIPQLKFDINKISLNCPAVWDMLGKGYTKGVFQLESNLGRQWTKKLKPEHIEHLAALGALLRPGCLRAIDENGISMTEHYCLRKNKEEPVEIFHPAIEYILSPTYGVLTYQEQAMEIAKAVAGFNLQQADELRKAIGKKLPEEMAKVKIKFIAGAKDAKVITEPEADQLFGWIEKSQRYSFNKSHAVSYAMNGYWSAFCKAHFPIQFFTSYLYWSQEKQNPQKEVMELINEARSMDVSVTVPDLRQLQPHFSTDGICITFGLSDIKGIGESQAIKVTEQVKQTEAFLEKKIDDWTWYDTLVHFTTKCTTTAISNIITCGGIRWTNIGRQQMLAEYKVWEALTDKEKKWIIERSLSATAKKNLIEALLHEAGEDKEKQSIVHELSSNLQSYPCFDKLTKALGALAPSKSEGGGTANKNRKAIVLGHLQALENPMSVLNDTPNWIAWNEENLLGIAVSCTKVDACDTTQVNTSCKDYLAGKVGFMIFGVEIQSMREVRVKKGKSSGQKMGFVTISDGTAAIDATCFADVWKEASGLLVIGNTVLIQAERDRRKDSLIVKKVYQM